MSAYDDLVTPNTDLLAYYTMSDASGAVAVDGSANGLNANYLNAPALGKNPLIYSIDPGDFSASFLAASSQAVTLTGNPLATALNGAKAATLEIWIKLDAAPAADARVGFIGIDGANEGLVANVNTSGQLIISARSAAADTLQLGSTLTLNPGDIYHVVCVMDFENGLIHNYRDGSLDRTNIVTFSQTAFTLGAPTEADAVIAGASGFYLDAQVAKWALYKGRLSGLDVRKRYNQGAGQGFDKKLLPQNNMAGYWPLIEIAGTDVYDQSPVGLNGTIVGGVSQNQAGGVSGPLHVNDKAYSFDGVDGRVEMTLTTEVPTLGSQWAWVNVDATLAADAIILSKRNGASSRANLWVLADGNVRLEIADSTVNTAVITTTGIDIRGAWHFVMVTFNKSFDQQIYIDGLLVASDTQSLPNAVGYSRVTLGAQTADNGSTFTDFFKGVMAKAGYANNLLSDSFVADLYQEGIKDMTGLSGENRGFSRALTRILLKRGYWRLDETQGTLAWDFDSTGKHGVISGGVTLGVEGPINGSANKAMAFDGVDGQISIPADASHDLATEFSVFIIAKNAAAVVASAQTLMARWNTTDSAWRFGIQNGRLRFTVVDAADAEMFAETDATITAADKWTSYLAVFDTGAITLYINGVAQAVTTTGTVASVRASALGIRIGARQDAGEYWNGCLAEAILGGNVPTAAQARQLEAAAGSRLQAEMISERPEFYAPYEDTSGTVAENIGLQPLPGAVGSAVTLAGASLAQSARNSFGFDGSNNAYVNHGGATEFNFFGGNEVGVTYMAWIKFDNTGQVAVIMSKGSGFAPDADAGPSLSVNAQGQAVFSFNDSSGGVSPALVATSSTRVDDGLPHFVVGTASVDRSGEANIYVDGHLEAIAENPTYDINDSSTIDLVVGASIVGGGQATAAASGFIDEPAVIPTALRLDDLINFQEIALLDFPPSLAFAFNGQLTESVSAVDFTVRAFNWETGALLGQARLTAGAYNIDVGDYGGLALLVAHVDSGAAFQGGKTYALDEYVLPTDTVTNNHFYKVTVGGDAGATEPTWPTDGSSVVSGGVTFLDQGALVKPEAQGPLPAIAA